MAEPVSDASEPDRRSQAGAPRAGRRAPIAAARLSAGADAQRVRLLPAAVLLRVGRGRVRAQRRHRRRRAAAREARDARRTRCRRPEAGERRSARARSTLSSDTHRLIAKIDLVEGDGRCRDARSTTRRGAPRDGDDGPEAWPADRVQVCVQALVLRDNGYRCDEAVLYYARRSSACACRSTRRWWRRRSTRSPRPARWRRAGEIPPPLVDSPKCPRCSLVGICLPDETTLLRWRCARAGDRTAAAVRRRRRRARAARIDAAQPPARSAGWCRRATTCGRSTSPARACGRQDRRSAAGEGTGQARAGGAHRRDLAGQPVRQRPADARRRSRRSAGRRSRSRTSPMGGWFYGLTQGLGLKNVFLRRDQFRAGRRCRAFCLRRRARDLVASKIRNQRTLLQRNHVEPPPLALDAAEALCRSGAEQATALDELLGHRGQRGAALLRALRRHDQGGRGRQRRPR